MKKGFSLLLAILMISMCFVPSAFAASDKYIEEYAPGDTIYYGFYPQSKVTKKSLIEQLNGIEAPWTSYGYYFSNKSADYMLFKDVELDSVKYRAVTFSKYRDFYTTMNYSLDTFCREENNYRIDNVFWFRFEPIKWKVLSPKDGLLVCESIIDSRQFYFDNRDRKTETDERIYPNNWAYSDIRTFLNETFFETAFDASRRNEISQSVLENKANRPDTSKFNAESTTDKVFLLSLDDINKIEYGFETTTWNSESRRMNGTDYALCRGLRVFENGSSYWRLRNAGDAYNDSCYINHNGARLASGDIRSTVYGVVPALRLKANTFVNRSTLDGETNPFEDCKCNCHKSGFMGFIWKIQRFFWKLFSPKKQICDCGVLHW